MNARVNFDEIYTPSAGNTGQFSNGSTWLRFLAGKVSTSRSLRVLLGVAVGAAASIALVTAATTLPATQHLSGLAALAAAIGVPMAMHSVSDSMLGRGLLRAVAALSAGLVAYQSLTLGWGVLGLSWALLFGWAVTDWIHKGESIGRTALLSGLLVMTGFTLTQI